MKSALLTIMICLVGISDETFAQTNNTSVSSKNKEMKQFSLLVRVPETYSTEQVKLAGQQWEALIERWKTAGIYVLSFAFPGEGYTISGAAEKLVKKESVLSGNLRVVSNIVLQVETIEQALEHAKSCPILLYGGTVEVREIPKPIRPTR